MKNSPFWVLIKKNIYQHYSGSITITFILMINGYASKKSNSDKWEMSSKKFNGGCLTFESVGISFPPLASFSSCSSGLRRWLSGYLRRSPTTYGKDGLLNYGPDKSRTNGISDHLFCAYSQLLEHYPTIRVALRTVAKCEEPETTFKFNARNLQFFEQ